MKNVRDFTLELLRHGPPHNQLLSPLTRYMALCASHGAETVLVPFEHWQFLERWRSLRYEHKSRETTLLEMAKEMGGLLETIPGLIAELARSPDDGHELIHLRLVVSASELALLPFELANTPKGGPGTGRPLLMQAVAPVTLTREVRHVRVDRISWPTKPKILFAAASPPGVGEIPFEAHLLALRQAIEPWVRAYDPKVPAARTAEIGKHLTILNRASMREIQDACADGGFTHVHVLAHGIERKVAHETRFGLALHESGNPAGTDLVEGARLATALRAHATGAGNGLSRPSVVTVASCDSGNVGSVMVPGASLAHDIHMSGIPLVVASQFPLSFAGSILMTRVLYERLLWGEDPRIILHDLRWQLHALDARTHDWASLVAYSALPPDLPGQLGRCRYAQAKEAIEAALSWADWLVAQEEQDERDEKDEKAPVSGEGKAEQEKKEARRKLLKTIRAKVERAFKRLDLEEDQTESDGLKASTKKREAQLLYRYRVRHLKEKAESESAKRIQAQEREALEEARQLYRRAFIKNMSSHWTGVQYLSMSAVLRGEVKEDAWCVSRVAAERDLESGDRTKVIWAHGSLCELYLLQALAASQEQEIEEAEAEKKKPKRRRMPDHVKRAREHARQLIELCDEDPFPIHSTRRQLERYRDWWKDLRPELVEPAQKVLEVFPEKGQSRLSYDA